jgi:hypothetical protein
MTIPLLTFSTLAAKDDYARIVVLADAHLPTKTKSVEHIKNKDKIIAAKEGAIKDINGWNDVSRVVCAGDFVANYGSDEEALFAADFFKKIKAPFSPITGNHDFFYIKNEKDDNRIAQGTPDTRKPKLERFKKLFGLPSLSYTIKENNVLLVFLSIDEINGSYSVKLSKQMQKWFTDTIESNKTIPIIVFCHAPLEGTLRFKKAKDEKSAYIEPKKEIADLLERNPQVFMWVSGHTHTSPKNPSFAADYNLFRNRVLDVHTPTMDDLTIYSNSLFIYNDRVEIRTFNHRTGRFESKFDRSVKIPETFRGVKKKNAA